MCSLIKACYRPVEPLEDVMWVQQFALPSTRMYEDALSAGGDMNRGRGGLGGSVIDLPPKQPGY